MTMVIDNLPKIVTGEEAATSSAVASRALTFLVGPRAGQSGLVDIRIRADGEMSSRLALMLADHSQLAGIQISTPA